MAESMYYGKTFAEIREIIDWWAEKTVPEIEEIVMENARLRGVISFYESRVKQMVEVMGKPNG